MYIKLILHGQILPLDMHFHICKQDKNLIHNSQLSKAKMLCLI